MSSEARRIVKLAACASFQEGYVNPSQRDPGYFGDDYKWLRATDLNDGFVFNTSRGLSAKGFASAGKSALLFAPNTLAISKSGTIGRVGILKDYMCGNRAVINIKVNPDCDTRFIFYTLLLNRQKIESLAEGSVQKNLYVSSLGRLEFELPSLPEQVRISETIGALDDRIALLRETNATLEAIAQAMFKSWFVDFDPVHAKQQGRDSPQGGRRGLYGPDGPTTALPEGMSEATAALFPDSFEESELGLVPRGWKVERLETFMELSYGKALKATERIFGEVPVYGSGGITGYHNESLVNGPSIVIGRKGTVGSLYWEDRPFFPIDTVFYVRSAMPMTYCFYLLQTLGLADMNTDAAVPGLNRSNVYRLKVLKAPEAVLSAFSDVVDVLRGSIFKNNQQAQTLATLRDTLLPRLISGQLRLPQAEAVLEAVSV